MPLGLGDQDPIRFEPIPITQDAFAANYIPRLFHAERQVRAEEVQVSSEGGNLSTVLKNSHFWREQKKVGRVVKLDQRNPRSNKRLGLSSTSNIPVLIKTANHLRNILCR